MFDENLAVIVQEADKALFLCQKLQLSADEAENTKEILHFVAEIRKKIEEIPQSISKSKLRPQDIDKQLQWIRKTLQSFYSKLKSKLDPDGIHESSSPDEPLLIQLHLKSDEAVNLTRQARGTLAQIRLLVSGFLVYVNS